MPRVPVPEKQKKAQAAAAKTSAKAAAEGAEKAAALADKRRSYMKKAAAYNKQYKAETNTLKALKSTAEKAGNFYSEPGAKFAFVVRIRGINDVAPKPRKILQLLRLRQIHTGVFIKLNKATLNMLKRVEAFVAWGYPSLSTVRQLLYKRGYLNVKGNRIPISENAVVEEALEKKTKGNVVCIEDMVNQIFTAGDKFSEVSHALWPFKLSTPNGGITYKNSHFVEGGDYGNRETLINALLARMI
eukprot:TRINITY_DN3898_c0_g2_i2.p2 TRINITY_DN3898_c0_g2~~TRINITY_DN3898_c0_g2_i2.p2  ORF type:complete len:261 (+),score=112.72 TRINITY_DN3898_c0_g2_i2:52-783(+)